MTEELLKKTISTLVAILEVLNTNNEIANLHDRELWSLHGELQSTIDKALRKAKSHADTLEGK